MIRNFRAIGGCVLLLIAATVGGCTVDKLQSNPRVAFDIRSPKDPGVKDVAWLSGQWVGPYAGGTYEEAWSGTSGGVMTSMSKTISGGTCIASGFGRIGFRGGGRGVFDVQEVGRAPASFTFMGTARNKFNGVTAAFARLSDEFPRYIRYTKGYEGGVEVLIIERRGTEVGQERVEEIVMQRAGR